MSEMKKVALARALIVGPSVILLDEPMSNLDSAVRARLRTELKLIQKEFRQTVLYVTHDQIEAMTMADRIAVMRDGAIEQIGTPREIYDRPRNRFVAEFIGEPAINLIKGHIDEAGNVSTEPHGLVKSRQNWRYSGDLLLGIRPFDVQAKRTPDATTVPAVITDIENLGAEQVVHFPYGRQLICAVVPRRFSRVGETLHVAFDFANVHAIDPTHGEVISNGTEATANRRGVEVRQ
jgi:multiple sugar transport system ATP-binding protein